MTDSPPLDERQLRALIEQWRDLANGFRVSRSIGAITASGWLDQCAAELEIMLVCNAAAERPLRKVLEQLRYDLSPRTEDVVRDGRKRYGRCEYCGNEPHHSTNGACDFRYRANAAADDVRLIIAELEQRLAAGAADRGVPRDHVHEYQHQQFWRHVSDVDGPRWYWVQRCVCGDERTSIDSGPLDAHRDSEPYLAKMRCNQCHQEFTIALPPLAAPLALPVSAPQLTENKDVMSRVDGVPSVGHGDLPRETATGLSQEEPDGTGLVMPALREDDRHDQPHPAAAVRDRAADERGEPAHADVVTPEHLWSTSIDRAVDRPAEAVGPALDLKPAKLRIRELGLQGGAHINAMVYDGMDDAHRHGRDPDCCQCDDIFNEANLLRDLVQEIERLRVSKKPIQESLSAVGVTPRRQEEPE